MAWIENQFGDVLLLKQVRGNKSWTLPGGKVRPRETIEDALRQGGRGGNWTENSDRCSWLDLLTDRKRR